MGIIASDRRLYGVDGTTGIEFLAAAVGTEIDEAEYTRLVAYNKKRGTAVETVAVAEPTRADLQARATDLGVEFKGNASKAALAELITAKEAEIAAAAVAAPVAETPTE
jgi:maltooligosyltrehalose synthase